MGKGMRGGDCGERDEGRGLWGKGFREETVGNGMQGGDCEERDSGRGLWGKGCAEGTVKKGMWGRHWGERNSGRGIQGGDLLCLTSSRSKYASTMNYLFVCFLPHFDLKLLTEGIFILQPYNTFIFLSSLVRVNYTVIEYMPDYNCSTYLTQR